MVPHPAAGLDMASRRGLDALAGQPQPLPQRLWITGVLTMRRPIRPTSISGVALQRPAQPKHRRPLPLQPVSGALIAGVEFEADHRYRPVVFEVRGLGLPSPPRQHRITADRGDGVGARGCHGDHETSTHRHQPIATPMAEPAAADRTNHRPGPPDRCPDPAATPTAPGRPWGLPLPVRVLLVLVRLRTNLTTRALAALTPDNPQWIASSTSWCQCWPADCDPARTPAPIRGSSTAP
jgi:hypothetical protein